MTLPHIQRIEAAADNARAARSLLRLWDAVEVYTELCKAEGVCPDENLDMSALPRFGGNAPGWVTDRGVDAILSWDRTHVLCRMEHGMPYRIIARAAQAA